MLSSTIEVRFTATPSESFTARPWAIPGNRKDLFTALRPTANILTVAPDAVFINDLDDRRAQLPFSRAKKWGLGEETRTIFARATAEDGQRFCLRFIFNADRVVRHGHPNRRFISALVSDANFYTEHLQAVAGVLVPHHYGMWTMKTGGWAGTVLFSLTQWCGTPWKSLVRTKVNTRANKLLIARTFELLHDVGINVNGRMGSDVDLCHVLLDVDDPRVTLKRQQAGHARCYIADFSEASTHECARRLPVIPFGEYLVRWRPFEFFGCHELVNVSLLLGFQPLKSSDPPETPVDEALQWYNAYREAHPKYTNAATLVAQRAALFPNSFPLYPGLEVGGVRRDDVTSELLLWDGGQGKIHPENFQIACTREDLAYKLWGQYMAASPAAIAMKKSDSDESSLGGNGSSSEEHSN
ncbi:hypothetical protein MIND_00682100 [Mycena indigotica]|uniref:Uncharacterized protein n=1 Tax=Mycena indigotica TaxID=2126181 RepID=A0A8H6SKP8_9AGAR|nr:uncharacterized protein MIND_00682100 [Mycena indigotica]KAF7301176.1 hypothetical protein MIND_00682100 [Mycena indigotica]